MTEKNDQPKFITFGVGYADVTLSRPLEADGNKLGALRMREPTVEDQLVSAESKGSEAAKEVVFMANLCGLAPQDIRKLPVRDYARLQAAFAGFID